MPVLEVKFLEEEASVEHEDTSQFGTTELEGPLDHPGEMCTWRYGPYGSDITSYLNPRTYLLYLVHSGP